MTGYRHPTHPTWESSLAEGKPWLSSPKDTIFPDTIHEESSSTEEEHVLRAIYGESESVSCPTHTHATKSKGSSAVHTYAGIVKISIFW